MKKKTDQSNSLTTKTLYVEGMHCASCEILVEKKLLKQDGVESVDASIKGRSVKVVSNGKTKLDLKKLNKELSQFGYTLTAQKTQKEDLPLFKIQGDRLVYNPVKLKNHLKTFLIFVSFVFAFIVLDKLNFNRFLNTDNLPIPSFFLLGIIAGLSSCAALIGGLLLSMIKQWNELYIDSDSTMEKSKPHIMFHIGRVLSFLILGGVLGLIGETISLNNTVFFAFLTIFISVVMLILAFQMLGVEWAQQFKFTAPKSLTKFAADEENFKGEHMPFLVGALTFFLPCGFTLVAQAAALASGSLVEGAMIMFFFVLGTLPILLGISYSGIIFNSKPHLTARFNHVAGLLIVFLSIFNINGQVRVLGYPNLNDLWSNIVSPFSRDKENSDEILDKVIELDEKGEQTLTVTAKGFEYIPTSSMTIKADIPSKLVVDNQGIQGCGSAMAANGLIDGYVSLRSGRNEINLGKPQKGTYRLTCTMGMVEPVIINVI